MVSNTSTYVEDSIEVAGNALHYLKQGDGAPLIVLHHSISNHGWLPLYERLAQSYTVYVPDLPGFGNSGRPDWARDVRDLAIIMVQFLDGLELEHVTLVGFGFGGWIAAEMATMNQRLLAQLVLVGAVGVQPREGAIADQMIIDYVEYVKRGFADGAAFDVHFSDDPSVPTRMLLYGGREMAMRVTFKPWMFRRSLPHLLRDVRTPAQIVWGSEDRLVPPDCGRRYAEALPNARLLVLEGAGHFLDFERPEELAAAILQVPVAAGRATTAV